MRALRLRLRAFGPFAKDELIDFEKLGAQTLFLIHGATGAGKTSLLDALCFALYGESSGERKGRQMRSHHAVLDDMTEVSFDFALGQEEYRIWRSPEQSRARKRGQGTTVERAKARLWCRTGCPAEAEGVVLSDQWSDVSRTVKTLLGFGLEQFRQIVLLPQGAFRRFLLADSRERQGILATLFRTHIFQELEQSLKNSAKDLAQKITALQTQRQRCLQRFQTENIEGLTELISSLRSREQVLKFSLKRRQKDYDAARDALFKLQKKNEAFQEQQDWTQRLSRLEARKAGFEEYKQRLERAHRATPLSSLMRFVNDQKQRVEAAERRLEKAHRDLQAAQRRAQQLDADWQRFPGLDDAIARLKDCEQNLARALKRESLDSELERLEQERAQAFENQRRCRQRYDLVLESLTRKRAQWTAEAKHWITQFNQQGCPSFPDFGQAKHQQLRDIERLEGSWTEASQSWQQACTQVFQRDCEIQTLKDQKALMTTGLGRVSVKQWRQRCEDLELVLQKRQRRQTQLESARESLSPELAMRKANCQHAQELLESETRELTLRQQSFDQEIARAQFKNREDWQQAHMSTAERERLGRQLQDFETDLHVARKRVQAFENQRLDCQQQALRDGRETERRLRAELDKALTLQSRLQTRAESLTQARDEFEQCQQQLSALEDQYQSLGRVAAVANGKNELRLSFERYVLASLFEDVLCGANEHLRQMSRGRYELMRCDARHDRRVSGGLELEVHDAYTGSSRPVATLSGGESFLASLSLALGLADVVQARCGGLRMDTLLVDEGFGSLDPEALEMALESFSGLQREGRVVGIISHVPELKERIEAQIEVKKGRKGSRVEMCV